MKNGGHWPIIIIGALVTNVLAVGTLIYFSGSDPAHHVEENYYQRAVTHDATMEQERANLRLAWKAAVSLSPVASGQGAELAAVLSDSAGKPITGAQLQVTLYHRTRASHRLRLTMREGRPGAYAVSVRTSRGGLWSVSLVARAGGNTFTYETTTDLRVAVAKVEGGHR